MILALMLLSVVVLLLLRVPVAAALLVPSLVYVGLTPELSLSIVLQRVTAGIDLFPLLAVPLFILTGNAANTAGITDRLFSFAETLIGHIRGSLGYVNVGVSLVFSWMSGAAIADAAALGKVEVPAMVQRGYSERFATGITAASSTIGPIMPPSIPAIIYAVTGGVSIGALFVAGVIPALLIALVLCGAVYVYARGKEDLRLERATGPALRRAALHALLPIGTPIIILGGILGGFFTPTEAAGIAVVYILLLAAIYRSLTWRGLYRMLLSTAETTGTIMLIVGSAAMFGWVLTREQAPQEVASAILGFTDNPLVFLIIVNILLLLVGMMLEPTAAILIMTPVLLPIATEFGIDPLHLGVFLIFNLMIGLLTPPVGLVLYVLSSVTDIPFPRVARGALPLLAPLGVLLLVFTFVPAVSMWLPSALGIVE